MEKQSLSAKWHSPDSKQSRTRMSDRQTAYVWPICFHVRTPRQGFRRALRLCDWGGTAKMKWTTYRQGQTLRSRASTVGQRDGVGGRILQLLPKGEQLLVEVDRRNPADVGLAAPLVTSIAMYSPPASKRTVDQRAQCQQANAIWIARVHASPQLLTVYKTLTKPWMLSCPCVTPYMPQRIEQTEAIEFFNALRRRESWLMFWSFDSGNGRSFKARDSY